MNQPIIRPRTGYKVVRDFGCHTRGSFWSAFAETARVEYFVGHRTYSPPGAGPLAVFTNKVGAVDFILREPRAFLRLAQCLYQPIPGWRAWPFDMRLYTPETWSFVHTSCKTGIRVGRTCGFELPAGTDLARWVELVEKPE